MVIGFSDRLLKVPFALDMEAPLEVHFRAMVMHRCRVNFCRRILVVFQLSQVKRKEIGEKGTACNTK